MKRRDSETDGEGNFKLFLFFFLNSPTAAVTF